MDGHAYFDFMKIVLMCIMWYACSTTDNILGKVILSDFPYPMTLTFTHLVTASVLLGPIKSGLKVPRGKPLDRRYYYSMIVPLALGKFVSSVSSYFSILKVSVSYAHTVKATLPLWTVILSRIIMGDKQTWKVYFALAPIITGVCIATATELHFDAIGLGSSLFATLCFSFQTIFTKKCLKDTGYHHLELLTFITRLSCAFFFPIWLLADFGRIMRNDEFLSSGKVLETFIMMACTGLFNTLHNVLAFSVLALTSPLSYAVANATKRIAIIGGSLIILQNPVSNMNVVGMLVAILGVLCYNKAKYDQHMATRREEVLPRIRSSNDIRQFNHLGVAHLPHSKSDANFMIGNGQLQNNNSPHNGNGHLLLQDWKGSEAVTLVPMSEEDNRRYGVQRPGINSSSTLVHSRTTPTHSRSVFDV